MYGGVHAHDYDKDLHEYGHIFTAIKEDGDNIHDKLIRLEENEVQILKMNFYIKEGIDQRLKDRGSRAMSVAEVDRQRKEEYVLLCACSLVEGVQAKMRAFELIHSEHACSQCEEEAMACEAD